MKALKKVLIIEDEEINAQRLQRLLTKIRPEFGVQAVLDSISQTVNWLQPNETPALIFMDIRLADGESFEIFNLATVNCPVIFTTAYDEYAVKAFKYNSIDYLLKPIEADELEAAILKFEKNTPNPDTFDQSTLIKNLLSYMDKKEFRTRFLLPYRDGYRKLSVDEVAFFFSELGITFSISFNGEKNTVPQTLESLEQELDPKYFFRANRQYIININAIERVHNYFNAKLKLEVKQCTDKEGIVVSRTKAAVLKEWLDY